MSENTQPNPPVASMTHDEKFDEMMAIEDAWQLGGDATAPLPPRWYDLEEDINREHRETSDAFAKLLAGGAF